MPELSIVKKECDNAPEKLRTRSLPECHKDDDNNKKTSIKPAKDSKKSMKNQ